jgi:methylmalonyl-CoA/ethylmalonyl-CoA epimerase
MRALRFILALAATASLAAPVAAHARRVSQKSIPLLGESGRVELLAPLAEDTPLGRFLARRGEGMHHLAFGVDDLPAALGRLQAAGATLIDEHPRSGIYGAVAFVHHESLGGVLSELVQATTVTEA